MPQGDWRVIEDRGQLGFERGAVQVERRRLSGCRKHVDRRLVNLHAAGCLWLCYGQPFDLQHRLVGQLRQPLGQRRVFDHNLRQPLGVAQHQKADVLQLP